MSKLRINTIHTRKKHDQCRGCVFHMEAACATEEGEHVLEFCTARCHKGILTQFKDKTERFCYDYKKIHDGGCKP